MICQLAKNHPDNSNVVYNNSYQFCNQNCNVYINFYFADSMTAYTDYVYNLDKLTIYVTSEAEKDVESLSGKSKCAAVTRLNNALFNPRLHFDCPEPLRGRYVYVKATGVPNRWRRLFTVVLCEVMVY